MSANKKQMQSIHSVPFIDKINQELTHLDTWWTAVSLVGKVNHQDIGGHFLQTLAEAQTQFQSLRIDFVHQLANITQQNLETTLSLRAQALVDLLFRNLFERTADVAFLAQDPSIAALCKCALDSENAYLETYCQLYTVYQNVAIFNKDLALTASARTIQPHNIDRNKLNQALSQTSYVEWHAPSASIHNSASIYYAHIIQHNGEKQGVLLLEFNLQVELTAIESFLTQQNPYYRLGLFEKDKEIWNKHKLSPHQALTIEQNHILLSKSFSSFQGYMGLPWQATACLPISSALSDNDDEQNIKQDSALFPSGLYHIQKLSDFSLLLVILNGKIISLQRNAQAFLPILEDFQRIGKSINHCLSSTISRIYLLNYDRIQTETRFSAELAADFFSRSFYERANDCRWWSLNQNLIVTIEQAQYAQASAVLTAIHELYTVYQSLVIFDLAGERIASSSLNHGQEDTPEKLDIDIVARLEPNSYLNITHIDADNHHLFSFYAPIRWQGDTIAIIGITFDTENQFSMMLNDVLPKNSDRKTGNYWAAFATEQGVFSYTENTPDTIKQDIWQEFGSQQHLNMGTTNLLECNIDNDTQYIAITRCSPYREFLLQSGFNIPVFAVVGQTI